MPRICLILFSEPSGVHLECSPDVHGGWPRDRRQSVSNPSDKINVQVTAENLDSNTETSLRALPRYWPICIWLRVLRHAAPASTSRCSANNAFTQSMAARTHAARRRSRWTMIQYSAAISAIGGVSRSSRG